jgi:hypothetical protein
VTDITEKDIPKRSRGNTKKQGKGGKGTRKPRETRKKKVAAVSVARDPTGRFLSSGNPNGRPTAALEVREMAREHGPEAIATLVRWMRSGDSQSSIAAAKILLDRGYGKSMQLLGSPNGAPLVNINLGNSAPITDPVEAARIYAEFMRDPSIDMSRVTFAPPERSAVVAELPASSIDAPIVAESNAAPLQRALPEALDARIAPIESSTAAIWESLSK